MVDLKTIRQGNASYAAKKTPRKTALFVGATSGIGRSTLETTIRLLTRPKIYVVGRSASRFSAQQQPRLEKLNPEATIVFIQAEISRLAEVDRVCRQLVEAESRLDFLCMSAGDFPVDGPIETIEGLEQCFVLSYFSRVRFAHNLSSLLRRSLRPRVLSIFNGGGEAAICEDDLGLKHSWTMCNLVYHATTFTTLVFEHLAKQNSNIAFIHTGPGRVQTNIPRKALSAHSIGFFGEVWLLALHAFTHFFQTAPGITVEESGERHAYVLTSDAFGSGVWRVGPDCETAARSDMTEEYRRRGWPEDIWNFTTKVWHDALARGA